MPPTYQQLWDAYASGQMSTTVMVTLLREDEVFAAWCKRRVAEIRGARDLVERERLGKSKLLPV